MINVDTTLEQADALLAPWAEDRKTPEPQRLDVALKSVDLVPAVAAMRAARWGYLIAITGLDLGVAAGMIEVLYHFCEGAAVVTLRVRTPREAPSVSSICPIIPAAWPVVWPASSPCSIRRQSVTPRVARW